MSDFLERAQSYHARIRDILLHNWDPIGVSDWDPIGVSDIPEAQDEYDGYVHEIHGMLIRHEPVERLIDHLWWIETSHMSLLGNQTRTERIAARLIELRERIEAGA
jgi:hypothetical protein